jgi:hypothetical protein
MDYGIKRVFAPAEAGATFCSETYRHVVAQYIVRFVGQDGILPPIV